MLTTYYVIAHRRHPRDFEPFWAVVKQTITQDGVSNEVIESGLTLTEATAMLIGKQEEENDFTRP